MAEVQFTAAISHEGQWYVARGLQVEVTSQGETVEEDATSELERR